MISVENISNKPNLYMENRHVQAPLFKSAPAKESESTEKENKRKKIAIGVSIAAVVLLLVLCRKKIKGLFDRSSGSSGPKKPDEPKKPETPKKPDKPSMPDETTHELNNVNKQNEENLAKYRNIVASLGEFPSNGTEEQKQNWHKLDDDIIKLRKILKENNVSIVEKKEFATDSDASFQNKSKYLRSLLKYVNFNEASQLDVMQEYEKYFSRYWIDRNTARNSIENLNTVYTIIDNNKEYRKMVFDRYLSMIEKFAQKDPDGMRDAETFSTAIEINFRNMFDENSAIRAIEILKKIAFQQIDVYTVELATKHLNSEKVNNAMKELKEIVKDMPYEHKYQG